MSKTKRRACQRMGMPRTLPKGMEAFKSQCAAPAPRPEAARAGAGAGDAAGVLAVPRRYESRGGPAAAAWDKRTRKNSRVDILCGSKYKFGS